MAIHPSTLWARVTTTPPSVQRDQEAKAAQSSAEEQSRAEQFDLRRCCANTGEPAWIISSHPIWLGFGGRHISDDSLKELIATHRDEATASLTFRILLRLVRRKQSIRRFELCHVVFHRMVGHPREWWGHRCNLIDGSHLISINRPYQWITCFFGIAA